MKLRNVMGGALALALTTTSVAASAAPIANPASSLSLSNARVGTTTKSANKAVGGGGFIAALIVAGIVAIGVVAIVKDDDSDSN